MLIAGAASASKYQGSVKAKREPIKGGVVTLRKQRVVARVGAQVDQRQECEIERDSRVEHRCCMTGDIGVEPTDTDVRKHRGFDDLAEPQSRANEASINPIIVETVEAVVAPTYFRRQRDQDKVHLATEAHRTTSTDIGPGRTQ